VLTRLTPFTSWVLFGAVLGAIATVNALIAGAGVLVALGPLGIGLVVGVVAGSFASSRRKDPAAPKPEQRPVTRPLAIVAAVLAAVAIWLRTADFDLSWVVLAASAVVLVISLLRRNRGRSDEG
jgi:F0F1-type ATP synthase membrane subunit c/vacuolar-type H+-ATPase subunit K